MLSWTTSASLEDRMTFEEIVNYKERVSGDSKFPMKVFRRIPGSLAGV
jgi:hypothetical protein